MSKSCPGCIGRGGGSRCLICGEQIPEHLQRKDGQPAYPRDYFDTECPRCLRGAFHTHL